MYIRRTDAKGHVMLLGRKYFVSATWCSRLVRAEVDLTVGEIRIDSLRRRTPDQHQLLNRHPYETPSKKFHE